MKIYRVSHFIGDEHDGYTFYESKVEAWKAAKEYKKGKEYRCEIEALTFANRKKTILALLNFVASHPDNG